MSDAQPPDTVYRSRGTNKLHVRQDCGGDLSGHPIESIPVVWRDWCLNCAEHLADGGRKPQDHSDADPPDQQPKHPVVGMDLYQWRTEDFALKHGLDESDMSIQFEKLEEEVLELKGALLFDDGDVAEELADVIFVAHLLGHMEGVDVREAFDRVSDENLEKNRETDEDGLITKDKEQ